MIDLQHETLVDVLLDRSERRPEKPAQIYLKDLWRHPFETETFDTEEISYQRLDEGARAIAVALREAGVKPGDRAVLLYPPGPEFSLAFLGCMYAGAVPAPIPLPRNAHSIPRVIAVVLDARPAVALTVSAVAGRIEGLLQQLRLQHAGAIADVRTLATDGIDAALAASWKRPALAASSIALLQYTSGSSATPKGVVVTHESLLHNERMIARGFRHCADTVVVAWLPTFHDMGLIGNTIQPICLAGTAVSMSPLDFLRNPGRWLQMISYYRATTSGAPNFAYDHCVRKVTPVQKEKLDLRSWQVAYNGSEPIHADTLDRFCHAFEPCGFRRSAFYPCYGLAEATLFVTGTFVSKTTVRTFDRDALEGGSAVPSAAAEGRRLVSCGSVASAEEVLIVDPQTRTPKPARTVGEIWVRGPSIASGYWQQPQATRDTFEARLGDGRGPFLRTGDLGFVDAGELFVTGRLKDLMIIRGRNIYPQDVERVVQESCTALKPDCGAAFTVREGDEERLVIVQEIARHADVTRQQIIREVRERVAGAFDLQVHDLALISPGSIPRTSSGKIRRGACRAAYLESALELV